MSYNFDIVHNRTASNASKWNCGLLKRVFGEEDILPLWVADMDFMAAKPIRQALSDEVKHGIFGYSFLFDEYFDAVVDWIERRHSWKIEKEWIVVSPGVITAICFLLQDLCKKGDKVIVQNPLYNPIKHAIISNACKVVDNPLVFRDGHYQMDFEDMERKAQDPKVKVMILCNPHNPSGRVWEREQLERLGRICIDNNIVIISDEIHNDLILDGNKHTILGGISEEFADNSIICTSPNKTFNLAGLGISNIIIKNDEIRKKLDFTKDKYALAHVNPFSIEALKAAYNKSEDWLEELLVYLSDNQKFIENFIRNKLPNVKLVKSEGTYLAWIDFNALGLSTEELKELIYNKAKVGLNNGIEYGEAGKGFMRLNFACPRSILKEALVRIEKAIKEKN